jgi:hypothetical protein
MEKWAELTEDPGREGVTKIPADRGKYRTMGLRNVAQSPRLRRHLDDERKSGALGNIFLTHVAHLPRYWCHKGLPHRPSDTRLPG